MRAWLYFLDTFIPVDLEPELFGDPETLFHRVSEIIVDELGVVRGVRVHRVFRGSRGDVLVEYLVGFPGGEVSVKVILSERPVDTLRDYYEYERRL